MKLVSVASQSVTHDAKCNMTLIPAVLRGRSQTAQQCYLTRQSWLRCTVALLIDAGDQEDPKTKPADLLLERIGWWRSISWCAALTLASVPLRQQGILR